MPNRETDNSGNLQGLFERISRNEESIEGVRKQSEVLEKHMETQEAKNEKRIDKIDERVEKLESRDEILTRLTVVSESQAEVNRQQSLQIERMSNTLGSIDKNLSLMNAGQVQLQKDITEQGRRVSEIERSIDSKKIDLGLVAKTAVVGMILGIIYFLFHLATGITPK